MKVLVTGGTGFVGRTLVRELMSRKHEIVLPARDPDRSSALFGEEKNRIQWLKCDLVREEAPAREMNDVDAAINLVGIISEAGAQTFHAAHVGVTRKLLSACLKSGVQRYIQMSALGTRANAPSRYHQTKWEAEQWVNQSRLDSTLFRPSMIFGEEDQAANLFLRMARFSPCLPLIGSGRGKLQPVFVRDVAQCFANALDAGESIGKTYSLCGDEVFSFKEWISLLLRANNKKRLLVPIPLPLARVQAAVLESVYPTLFRSAPPLNRDQIRMLQEDNVGDNGAAKRDLGFQPVLFSDWIHRPRD